MRRAWVPATPLDMACPDCKVDLQRGTLFHDCASEFAAVAREREAFLMGAICWAGESAGRRRKGEKPPTEAEIKADALEKYPVPAEQPVTP